MRIQIESLLIDLNEEIFAISEELSNALQASSFHEANSGLLLKAREYEQKKIALLTKIKNNVSNNPLTQVAKKDNIIQRSMSRSPAGRALVPDELDHQTPPQRDRSAAKDESTKQNHLSRLSALRESDKSRSGSRSPLYKRERKKTADQEGSYASLPQKMADRLQQLDRMNVCQDSKALREYGQKLRKREPSADGKGHKVSLVTDTGSKKQRKGRGKQRVSNYELYKNFANNSRSSSSVKKKHSPNLPLRNRA